MNTLTKKQNSFSPDLSSKTTTLPLHSSKIKLKSPGSKININHGCLLCENKQKTLFFPIMIQRALYSKFSSSQNYYYTREINDILLANRTVKLINYRDIVAYDEEAEYLKRSYITTEFQYKIRILTEYYKYHRDIPRLFMIPITNILNKYLDKRRRLDYIKITKMIKEEQKKEGKAIDNNFEDSLRDTTSQIQHSVLSLKPLLSQKDNIILKEFYEEKSINNNNLSNQTITDWNAKLKELTSSSIYLNESRCSYLEIDKNESFRHLTRFLEYLNRTEINTKIAPLNNNNNEQPFNFMNKKNQIKFPLDFKKINLKDDFPISSSNPSNKASKKFIFEKPELNMNIQKLSLCKKIAILNEKTKGNLMPMTERSENARKKITELFSHKNSVESKEIKRIITPDNKNSSPIVKIQNLNPEKLNKNITDDKRKQNALHTQKLLKFDQNILNFLMKNLFHKKESAIQLKKSPTKVISKPISNEFDLRLKEKDMIAKKKQGFLPNKSKENSGSLSLKANEKPINISKPNEFFIDLASHKKSAHNRIFSNDNIQRNSQPNPLYFEKKSSPIINTFRPETSKEKPIRSNKANLLRSTYNNFMHCHTRMSDIPCLTERNHVITPKPIENHNLPQNISHKYTKSEPKLLKNEESTSQIDHLQPATSRITQKNPSLNQFYTYNNNNVVNIYVNDKEINRKLPPSRSALCFEKIKGNLNKMENSKNESNTIKKVEKQKFQLDLHLNLKTG